MACDQESKWRALSGQDCHWLGREWALKKGTEGHREQTTSLFISMMEVEKLLVQQYNNDFPDHNYDSKGEMSQKDSQFMQSMQKTISEKGHYSIGLPLKKDKLQMPNNHCVAEQRVASLLRKFKKNPESFED